MHKLMEYICTELEEIERKADKDGKLSMSEIDYADKLAHLKKNLLKSEDMWENSEYSTVGKLYDDRSYARRSYARGRRRGANQYGSYAMGDNYSRAEDFRMELEDLIEDAPNDHVKKKMRELVREM